MWNILGKNLANILILPASGIDLGTSHTARQVSQALHHGRDLANSKYLLPICIRAQYGKSRKTYTACITARDWSKKCGPKKVIARNIHLSFFPYLY